MLFNYKKFLFLCVILCLTVANNLAASAKRSGDDLDDGSPSKRQRVDAALDKEERDKEEQRRNFDPVLKARLFAALDSAPIDQLPADVFAGCKSLISLCESYNTPTSCYVDLTWLKENLHPELIAKLLSLREHRTGCEVYFDLNDLNIDDRALRVIAENIPVLADGEPPYKFELPRNKFSKAGILTCLMTFIKERIRVSDMHCGDSLKLYDEDDNDCTFIGNLLAQCGVQFAQFCMLSDEAALSLTKGLIKGNAPFCQEGTLYFGDSISDDGQADINRLLADNNCTGTVDFS